MTGHEIALTIAVVEAVLLLGLLAWVVRRLRDVRTTERHNEVRRADVIQHADALAVWLQDLEADAPCGHPACQHKRDDAWRILGRR